VGKAESPACPQPEIPARDADAAVHTHAPHVRLPWSWAALPGPVSTPHPHAAARLVGAQPRLSLVRRRAEARCATWRRSLHRGVCSTFAVQGKIGGSSGHHSGLARYYVIIRRLITSIEFYQAGRCITS
jgi:hypothetical protein